MSKLGQTLKHEIHELIPVTGFFFVAFELLAVTEALMLKQYGISTSAFLGALVLALLVGKAVLLSDHFSLVNGFRDRPLAINIVWRTMIYFAALFVIRYAEHLFHFWRQTRELAGANRRMIAELVWPHFWALQLWSAVLLLVYCTFRELVRVLGCARLQAIFFERPGQ